MIHLDSDLEQQIETQARTRGYEHPNAYLRVLLAHAAEVSPTGQRSDGWSLVEQMRGTATRRISADQIMAQTRSEV